MLSENDITYLELLSVTERLLKYIENIDVCVNAGKLNMTFLTLQLAYDENDESIITVINTFFTFDSKSDYIQRYVKKLEQLGREDLALIVSLAT